MRKIAFLFIFSFNFELLTLALNLEILEGVMLIFFASIEQTVCFLLFV